MDNGDNIYLGEGFFPYQGVSRYIEVYRPDVIARNTFASLSINSATCLHTEVRYGTQAWQSLGLYQTEDGDSHGRPDYIGTPSE
jgi:hypothetical protein